MAAAIAQIKPLTKHDVERQQESPAIPYVDTDGIPRQLRGHAQWVLWRWEWSEERACRTKVPKLRRNGRIAPAKSTDPDTWGPFRDSDENGGGVGGQYLTLDCFCEGRYGLGFVLTAEDPFTVIDLDDCRDRSTGEITAEARATIDRFDTYAEVSPSGTGVKLFLRGTKPGERCRTSSRPGVEVYDRARFVAVTGQHLEGTPGEPQNRQAQLDAYYAELFPEIAEPAAQCRQPVNLTLSDEAVIRRASAARNGERFMALWGGVRGGDDSADDFALACILAFWCGNDPQRIISLMWQSGLVRDKWRRPDYLPRTVSRAIESRSQFFGDLVFGGEEKRMSAESPIRTNDKGDSADTALVADPLAELPEPPPPCACRRGGSSLLSHSADPARFRACRHACDSWGCEVCRRRNAHQWATHLVGCIDRANGEGRRLFAGRVTRTRLDGSLAARLFRCEADWAALEVAQGLYLVIAAVPEGASAPEGLAEVPPADAGRLVVDWALLVWGTPFAVRPGRKIRPVRTSAGWRLNRPETSGEWRVVAPLDAALIDEVLEAVRAGGGRVTCDVAEARPGGSLVWLLEWRADPDAAERIRDNLREIGRDFTPAKAPDEDHNPFDNPGG